MFILTDWLFENDKEEQIKNSLKYCLKNGINVIGIGVGVFPIGIDKLLYNQVFFEIWSKWNVKRNCLFFWGVYW